jgi:hypothetical protein
MNTTTWQLSAWVLAAACSAPAMADWTDARCDIYPKGSDHMTKMVPCVFAQSQGYITLTLKDDGTVHEFAPVGDTPGNFRDQGGRPVYRQSGLGAQGQIFRLHDQSIFVYWDTSALNPPDEDNATAPFSTRDYDATTLLRCKASGQSEMSLCPAGIGRMENNQASITIKSPGGEIFTINFMSSYVNATNHEVDAKLSGDTWTVTLDNGDTYEVPMAAITGG